MKPKRAQRRADLAVTAVWFERDRATGARIELVPASEPFAVAEAVSKMVAGVRQPPRPGVHAAICQPDCDCVGCEFRQTRRLRHG